MPKSSESSERPYELPAQWPLAVDEPPASEPRKVLSIVSARHGHLALEVTRFREGGVRASLFDDCDFHWCVDVSTPDERDAIVAAELAGCRIGLCKERTAR